MKQNKALGIISLFSASVIWGGAFVFQSTGMDYMGPFTFTAVRIGLGAISVFIVQILTEKKKAFKIDKRTFLRGLICGILTFGVIAFQQIGLTKTEPGKAGFITSLYIMLVPVIGTLAFGRREPVKTWIGVVGGLLGLYLLCVEKGQGFQLYTSDALIMACAVFFALHVLFVDRYCDGANPLGLNVLQLSTTSILAFICAVLFETPTAEGIINGWLSISYCGILSAGLGYTLQFVGQRYVKPTVAAIIMALESVFSVIFGWIILDSVLSIRELVGCFIMLCCSIIIQLPSRHEMKLHQDPVNRI